MKKPTSKKLKVLPKTKISASPYIHFKSTSHAKLWDSMRKRTLVRELTLHAKDFEGSRIEELLGETNLLGTVSKLPPFVHQILKCCEEQVWGSYFSIGKITPNWLK